MARPSYDSDQPRRRRSRPPAKGDIAPIYCLSGERFLVDAAVAAIRAAVLAQAGAAAAFNHDTFDLKESGVGAAIGTARTLPMMAKRRLVIGKAIDEVKAADLEPLLAYVEDPNPSTCLVLIGDKVDVRLKAFAALRKRGFLHVFAPLRDNALAGWLRTEAHGAQASRIEPDAASALATLAGPELGRLAAGAGAARDLRRRRAADRRRRRRGPGRRDARARRSSS